MSIPLTEWYRGRRVFLTGHTGFKGSWLLAWLQEAGARVTGYALPPENGRPSLFDLARLGEGVDSVLADVRDRGSLDSALAAAEPEIVFHLAAQSLVRRSYSQAVATFETNVIGTANLLDALRGHTSVRGVVVVTSDKCYENQDLERGYVESDPMGGHDPYSASKACQELLTAAFRRSFLAEGGVATATARAGNVIGGGDWSEDRLMTDLITAATEGRPCAVRQPDAVRPWQHVLEPLRGYLMLGRALCERGEEVAEGWNFGPSLEEAVTVRELVTRMSAAWPRLRAEFGSPIPGPHEARLLRLDNAKARARLGWTPALSLDETVDWTVGWYRAVHENPGSARAMLLQQLDDYRRRTDDAGAT
ncbi:MAG TPA: CDP-glucose 4,6-dehydratase [Gemmatimonadaceae bacterium]|nr:CDP-glucose 4,6-dehydratase [Gemmatimonadaceae bacterium]